ncbi:hypothetical protein ACQPW3_11695 [Actinosynnema sp. CA-248983]
MADDVVVSAVTGPKAVAWTDRPRCGRPTRTGEPCAAVVRYSVPLEEFTPACPKHLTAAEQQRLADEPLWSPLEQVHWLLDRLSHTGEPIPAHRIATRLKIQQPVVVRSLYRLVEQDRAAGTTDDRCDLWGTPEAVARWTARRRELARLEDLAAQRHTTSETRCRQLAEMAERLHHACEERDISITYNPASERPAIVLTLTEPEAARWLLSNVEGVDTCPGTEE